MLDIFPIVAQCFFLSIFMFCLVISPALNGIAEYRYSKSNKKVIYIFAIIISLALFFGILFLIPNIDKENVIGWYAITIITAVPSGYILLLDIDNYAKPIQHPSKLKEYICNARYEIFKGKSMCILRYCKVAIYLYYILVMLLNQIGKLYDNCFSDSLYLQINEYSLIILFAIVQMKNEVGKKS